MSEEQLTEIKGELTPRKERPAPPPRIAGIDPGKMQSGFAMVGIEVEDNVIYIIGARQWKHQDYNDVEEAVAEIHNTVVKRPFNHIAVERNNTGVHVIENMLREHALPILPINTGSKLMKQKTIIKGNTMDKNDMVGWVKRMLKMEKIVFPIEDSEGTKQLRAQLPKFTRHITDAGNVAYRAQGKQNDDLVMALILACYVARRKYLYNTGMPAIATSKYNFSKIRKKKRMTQDDYLPEFKGDRYAKVTNYQVFGPQ